MKYPNTKRTRNKAVIDFCKSHPELSQAEVGEVFGITKQRVSAIKKRFNHENISRDADR